MVLILFPEEHIHPELSGRVLHSSPSRHGSISHHHFPITMEAGEGEQRCQKASFVILRRDSRTQGGHRIGTPTVTDGEGKIFARGGLLQQEDRFLKESGTPNSSRPHAEFNHSKCGGFLQVSYACK